MTDGPAVGDEHIVDVGPLAHGGHCIAHAAGRTVFVRHTWPGERVRIRVTEASRRMVRADAVEVIEPSPDRIEPACRYAGRCGGCDFQHVTPVAQRRELGRALSDVFSRVGRIDADIRVRAVTPDDHGWRTRMTFAVDDQGHAGLRAHRSHAVIPIESCTIAHANLPSVWDETWGVDSVTAVSPSAGAPLVVTDRREATMITEQVRHRSFSLRAGGFWQVHPRAAETLVEAVLRLAEVQPGDRIADLYGGAGLFSAFLAEQTGPTGEVVSIEGDRRASDAARENLADLPQAAIRCGPVERIVPSIGRRDVVVLDPPRAGAKAAMAAIVASRARRIVYVSCDAATQARDLALLRDAGYSLDTVEAYALFPMTHHVETVAQLTWEESRR